MINFFKEITDMTIEIKRNAEQITIEITGRLDTTTAPSLDKIITEDIADAKNLVLDFTQDVKQTWH